MIQIEYLKSGESCNIPSGTTLSCEGRALTQSMILYVSYTKGSESGFSITVDFLDSTIQEWFPLQQFDGTNINRVVFNIQDSGQYRIPIPIAVNEEMMKVNVNINGTDDASTNISIRILPEAYNA